MAYGIISMRGEGMKWQNCDSLSETARHYIVSEQAAPRGNAALGSTDANDLLERAARLVGYASAKRYRNRGSFLFQGIPLQTASVLEVGCGKGAWAIWAALNGAARSVGIDPE